MLYTGMTAKGYALLALLFGVSTILLMGLASKYPGIFTQAGLVG